MKRYFIRVQGIVQGVGFRPFVYKQARAHNLFGWVNNNSSGVYIDVQGEEQDLQDFLKEFEKAPPLSKIENIAIELRPLERYTEFNIVESEEILGDITLVSPDMSVCEDCIRDITTEGNPRYGYAFTNCTNCGPRFSIIERLPYDRDKTTMESFKMCESCAEEYKNPEDRRFHAQPNACPSCGPRLWVTDSRGNEINTGDSLKFTREKLKGGAIFAIKGLGGFHFVCDGENEEAVSILRQRKLRPHKPFALMMANLETIRRHCVVTPLEEKLLCGTRKPIVILKRGKDSTLPYNIAPKQSTLGVMLPYTPLHYLLFDEELKVLIMTSANRSGFPLEYTNERALNNLSSVVDFFLLHNREIHVPVDDSVVRVIGEEEFIIRRARGYAPEDIICKGYQGILACGSHMKNTFALGKSEQVFVSQHIGDLYNIESYRHFIKNVEHFKSLFDIKPSIIAVDMHPDYYSSKYGRDEGLPVVEVQHHHAHALSVMAEHNIDERVIGVIYDGTGFGTDGCIWGGEVLVCSRKDFKRFAHLRYTPMPGGEKAVLEPYRMTLAYLWDTYGVCDETKEFISRQYGKEAVLIWQLLDKSTLPYPKTSSMGRLLDGLYSLISGDKKISYEAQAAIELEELLQEGAKSEINSSGELEPCYEYKLEQLSTNIGEIIVDYRPIIKAVMADINRGTSNNIISQKIHNTVVNFTFRLCILGRQREGINKVVLGGGVFQNKYIFTSIKTLLEDKAFMVYYNRVLPVNDGGLCLGQMLAASSQRNR